jgi:DNA transposition AAA+ family ATPase
MKSVFVETDNVTKFRRAVAALEDVERGQPGIMLAWGQAGRGKTFAGCNYHSERGGIYLDVWEDWSQTAMMQALCFEVTGHRPRSANMCKIKICGALDKAPKTIFVDEADRLPFKRIEDLRDIHKATGASIVLIGEEELISLLGHRRRVWSRVTQELEFGPVTESDIATYALEAADLDLEPEACSAIGKASEGDFRLAHSMIRLLEDAAKARQTATVDLKMVQSILKMRSWRRG